MSADPFDVWSAVESSWDFGDGGTGTGASVHHCYSTPGERTVTVTGTDGAANETSTSGTIVIEPNPDIAAGIDPCDFEPPDPPQLTGTDPPSPALGGTPRILGATEPGSTVLVFLQAQRAQVCRSHPGARARAGLARRCDRSCGGNHRVPQGESHRRDRQHLGLLDANLIHTIESSDGPRQRAREPASASRAFMHRPEARR